jgi:hypothetical protein
MMLKKWRLKAIIQKGFFSLPIKIRNSYFLQRFFIEKALLTDDSFELKMIHVRDHLIFFKKEENSSFEEKIILELGSNWHPIVPVALFLSGFEAIVSLDTVHLITKKTIIDTLEMFVEWSKNDKLDEYLEDIDSNRWSQLQEVLQLQKQLDREQICRILRLKLMEKDARDTALPAQFVDYIISDNVYEHLNPLVLKFIIKEFKRILAPKGMMSHFVDLSDHFARFDKSITIYNFLKYNEKQWQKIDNSIESQNRLRGKDYEQMYNDLDIAYTSELMEMGSLETLSMVKTNEMFADYLPQELAIRQGYLVTRG